MTAHAGARKKCNYNYTLYAKQQRHGEAMESRNYANYVRIMNIQIVMECCSESLIFLSDLGKLNLS